MNTCEKDIIKAVFSIKRHLCTSYDIAIPNCYTQHDNEADLFFIRKSGLCDEIEVKVAHSDLLQDKKKIVRYRKFIYPDDFHSGIENPHKKPKMDALAAGELTCNYFWYAIKEGIGTIDDIPEWAGLIIVDTAGKAGILRWPKRLHRNKLTFEQRYKFARKLYYRYWGVKK